MIHVPFTRDPRPGETIRGEVRIPEGPPPTSAVVVVHGFKGFKDWGFFPHLCRQLAAAGHAVVSFNFTRNGIGSDPLEFTELDSFGTNTFSIELDEVRLILDEVFDGNLLPRAPRKVGLLGHSRGGGQAIPVSQLISKSPQLSGLGVWQIPAWAIVTLTIAFSASAVALSFAVLLLVWKKDPKAEAGLEKARIDMKNNAAIMFFTNICAGKRFGNRVVGEEESRRIYEQCGALARGLAPRAKDIEHTKTLLQQFGTFLLWTGAAATLAGGGYYLYRRAQ